MTNADVDVAKQAESDWRHTMHNPMVSVMMTKSQWSELMERLEAGEWRTHIASEDPQKPVDSTQFAMLMSNDEAMRIMMLIDNVLEQVVSDRGVPFCTLRQLLETMPPDLGLTHQTLGRWDKQGKLPYWKPGRRRLYRPDRVWDAITNIMNEEFEGTSDCGGSRDAPCRV